MSRVSQAFRRVRNTEAPGAKNELGSSPDLAPDHEVPWDFTAPAAAPDGDALDTFADTPKASADWERPAFSSPQGQSLDEMTLLAQRLFQRAPSERPVRSVLFSAVGPEETSAGVCAGAADALARQAPGSVCVVDANLRAPNLDRLLGVSGTPSAFNPLLDSRPIASSLIRIQENLWLLPGGAPNPEGLSGSGVDRFRGRLKELLTTFAYVVVDGPAAGVHREATMLSALVDGVVLVVDASATRREAARRTAANLRAASITLLGAVLTNRTFPIPDPLYRRL